MAHPAAVYATAARLARAIPSPDEWAEMCGADMSVICGDILHAEDLTREPFSHPPVPHLCGRGTPVPKSTRRPASVDWLGKLPKEWEPPRKAPFVIRTVAIKRSGRLVARCRFEILNAAGLSDASLGRFVQKYLSDIFDRRSIYGLTDTEVIAALNQHAGIT